MSEKVGKIEIVIKGGQPWGFRLQAKAENRSVVIVDEIVKGGRADQQGELKVGDHVIKINGIQCLSLADALQLIDSAFRTLTIVVWRTSNFLNKDRPKDYFDAVHQFDQLPNNAPCQSDSNPQTASIYENINFRFQEGKQRDRRVSPVENVYHINNKDISATSAQHLPCNNSKVYPGRNDYYKNNLKTPYSCLDKTFKNEPEKKAMSVYNPERKLHSKTQRDLHQYSNVQPLPALNYMPEINKYERRHFSRTPKEIRQYSNVHSINDSTYGKIFNISDSSDPTSVPSIPVQGNNVLAMNHNLGQYPVNSMLTNTKVSDESHCCRYPNCHNKYLNCKIHSPPERDVTYPVRQSFQNDYENIDFISQPNFTYKDQSNCESLNYEQNVEEPMLNSVPFVNKKKVADSKTMKWEKDPVPSNPCDFLVTRSSTNPSNYDLEESVNVTISKASSDTHGKSQGGNLVSSLKWEKDSVPTNTCDFPVIKSSTNPSNYELEESLNDIISKTASDTHGKSQGGNSVSSLKWEKDSVPSNRCDFPVIKSSTSPSNYKLEESINNIIPKTTSDTLTKSMGGNSVSTLCHFSSSVYDEKVNSQGNTDDSTCQSIKGSDIFQYKTVNGQIQPMSHNVQGKELGSECLYSNSCDAPVIKSSTNVSNYKLEESVNYIIPKTTSDTHAKPMDRNSMSSLCHFSNNIYEEKVNSQSKIDDSTCQSIKDSNIFQYKTVYGQIQPMSHNVQGKELVSECLYSNSCDVPVIKSSTNVSNCNFEGSVNIIPKTTSDAHSKSVGGNSMSSLHHFSNVYEEKIGSQGRTDNSTFQPIKDSDIFQYKSVYGQIKPMSYNLEGKESASKCLYSSCSKPSFNKRMFSSVNNASFIKENDVFFDASNNSMCMISKEAAVVKLISSRPQQIYIDEDDELKEIDENRNKTAAAFSPIRASPPLPSPPPENDSEILPCNEPLPSPPLFVAEQKQNSGNEMVETIYANLEMLKIQYSVVSSSSQTSASNEKHSVKYSNSVGDIAANVSSAENTSHPVLSEFVETKPQVDASFLGKVFQNQEEKIWRRVLNLPFNSAYFTTSVPKAKFLTRYTSKLQPNKMTEVKELSNEKGRINCKVLEKVDILLEEELLCKMSS
ncbi:hypothetical protein AVEN_156751-1 [Araneus ventricosus]|uniref:PDZ domain-containing protein n=1 Tax=Araneus ventricosus TaxID=182803 RepID=A0A4Y2KIL2_ARAVE|nr:hypothetical protein AVEN_156751-1 [Araneus ventricosus]